MLISEFLTKKLLIDESIYRILKEGIPNFELNTSYILNVVNSIGYYEVLSGFKDPYERTILFYIIKYLEDPIFSYTYEQWESFCSYYRIDISPIEKLITSDSDLDFRFLVFDDSIIDLHLQLKRTNIIDDMFKYQLILQNLSELKMDASLASLQFNTQLYRDIAHCVTMLNVNVSTRESMEKGYFDRRFTPQDESIGNISAIYEVLYIIQEFSYDEDKDMLENLYHAYNNYIKIHIDMIFIILSLQVIKVSPFASTSQISISEKIIRTIMKLLKGARVIGILKNDRYFCTDKEWFMRDADDDTTRLQILYEYYNGDQYSLRLDLSHKGVNSFHLNNLSKGKIDYFPIDSSQIEKVYLLNHEYKEWFINYNNDLFFLKDRYKSLIHQSEHEKLEEILKTNKHFLIPELDNEENVLNFLDFWLKFFVSLAKDMPKEKINPNMIYYERFIYGFIEEYFYRRKVTKDFNEGDFKSKIIAYTVSIGLFDSSEIDILKNDFSVTEVLSYMILLIQQ
ncbi:MAG: hypothetical protein N3I35_00940 [Clostridia bacterium]|nr:hypothetical protein [Clostridia bacterium]